MRQDWYVIARNSKGQAILAAHNVRSQREAERIAERWAFRTDVSTTEAHPYSDKARRT